MIWMITGGSASGKSEFAGRVAEAGAHGRMIHYLATMHPDGEEAQKKIQRHESLRTGGAYLVHEVFSVEALQRVEDQSAAKDVILFDSIDGFAAAVMFSRENPGPGSASADKAKEKTDWQTSTDEGRFASGDRAKQLADEILSLAKDGRDLILVADDIGCDGVVYDEVTQEYMMFYGNICRHLAECAHKVVHVVCGIPVYLKGEELFQ